MVQPPWLLSGEASGYGCPSGMIVFLVVQVAPRLCHLVGRAASTAFISIAGVPLGLIRNFGAPDKPTPRPVDKSNRVTQDINGKALDADG